MKKKGSGLRTTIAILLMAIVIVGAFAYLSNRTDKVRAEAPAIMTPVQEVLSRNLKTDYPATPKELLKYYSEITRCFYSEDYSDEELENLADRSRELFDDELAQNQTREQYLASLKLDIDSYHNNSKSISSYSVSSSTDVDYYNYEGYEWAQLYCIYSVRISTAIEPVQEHFLLRKDEDGHWKIFGWKIEDPNKEELAQKDT